MLHEGNVAVHAAAHALQVMNARSELFELTFHAADFAEEQARAFRSWMVVHFIYVCS